MKRVQILMLIGALLIVQKAHAHGNHGEGMHEHKEVQGIKNPLQATRTNIAEGCELYKKHCVSCHGISGKGDGKDGNGLNPPPDSLTHKVFKHGGTPGEIHMIITDGVLP
ncbi:MAG: c-type cytochrome, partial [Candidatus Magnetominusculus sp. LBB02]|nr:c-type cytochrome [Candidatus Magnetominusculus sp. LBB02]